jgi:hypothetical protein
VELAVPCDAPFDLGSSLRGFFLVSLAGLAESFLTGRSVFDGVDVGFEAGWEPLGFPSFGGALFPSLGFACCPCFLSPPPVAEDHAEVAFSFHCLPVAFVSEYICEASAALSPAIDSNSSGLGHSVSEICPHMCSRAFFWSSVAFHPGKSPVMLLSLLPPHSATLTKGPYSLPTPAPIPFAQWVSKLTLDARQGSGKITSSDQSYWSSNKSTRKSAQNSTKTHSQSCSSSEALETA